MKSIATVFLALALPLTGAATPQEETFRDIAQSEKVLDKIAPHIKAIAVTAFCERPEVNQALQKKLIPAIMLESFDPNASKSDNLATTQRLYAEAQFYVRGIILGLKLAVPSKESRDSLCSVGDRVASEILAKPDVPQEP